MKARLMKAITVAAVAAGLTVGVAAPANAAGSPDFAPITQFGVVQESASNDFFWIPVSGVIPMNQVSAQAYINGGSYVHLQLWGDDEDPGDDLQYTYPNASLTAQADGLHWTQSARVPRSVVDEDGGSDWRGRKEGDELYVKAMFKTPQGIQMSWGKSNVVRSSY